MLLPGPCPLRYAEQHCPSTCCTQERSVISSAAYPLPLPHCVCCCENFKKHPHTHPKALLHQLKEQRPHLETERGIHPRTGLGTKESHKATASKCTSRNLLSRPQANSQCLHNAKCIIYAALVKLVFYLRGMQTRSSDSRTASLLTPHRNPVNPQRLHQHPSPAATAKENKPTGQSWTNASAPLQHTAQTERL